MKPPGGGGGLEYEDELQINNEQLAIKQIAL
jgi:hypothetical protein